MKSSVRYTGKNFKALSDLIHDHCKHGSMVYRRGDDVLIDDMIIPVGYCLHVETSEQSERVYISADY
jgi:hypothetical protein